MAGYCHRKKRALAYVIRAGIVVIVFCLSLSLKFIQQEGKESVRETNHGIEIIRDKLTQRDASFKANSGQRKLLAKQQQETFPAVYVMAKPSNASKTKFMEVVMVNTTSGIEVEEFECTQPAYHEFPPDGFTSTQRRRGGLIVHVLVVTYMFVALALVCDIYFVASLEKICQKLNLSEDVAGATFMAAGSSAPEVFTSILGVFVAKGDVGVGTIVGSAVFNILFVIGICGMLVLQPTVLTWWPIGRDSVFYCLSVIILIASISDGAVAWYEALIMILLYVAYIVMMKFNSQLQTMALNKFKTITEKTDVRSAILQTGAKVKYYTNYEHFTGSKNNENPGTSETQSQLEPVIHVDSYIHDYRTKLSFEDACFQFMKTRRFRPLTRFKAAAHIIILERRKLLKDAVLKNQYVFIDGVPTAPKNDYDNLSEKSADVGASWKRIPSMESDGLWSVVKWVVLTPLNIALYFTIPDCSKERWDRWFMATFFLSIVWIAVFSYIMVWMVALIGYSLGIPDSIMGITFLAAGTSVPDAMASVMVARQGQGDMAVSNTLGSNVFDICVGLAVPWFIQTAFVASGSTVHINSNGIVFSVVLLFLTVIVTLVAVHMVGWVLNKKLGVVCLLSYAVFLTFSIMIEFNVFGYVNPPMCPE